MPCYHPVRAFQCADGSVVFVERARYDVVRTLELSCGRCIGCRLERSRQWAIRCMHEAQLHKENCFITLTYDELLSPSLEYRDFQLFMKRLRKLAARRVRFYMCGEYGEEFGRPHFHACIFGYSFPDQTLWRKAQSGSDALFRSRLLERAWPHGFASVGTLNFRSAGYVARYVMKKVLGDGASSHYKRVFLETGEIVDCVPEFNHMSLKPGIGAGWLSRFRRDVYPDGMVVVNGKKVRPPKYYDRCFAKTDPDGFAVVAFERENFAHARSADSTDARLAVREEVARARASLLKRKLT